MKWLAKEGHYAYNIHMYMKVLSLLFLSLFASSEALAYLSYGDGSETCNWTSDKELDKAIWNCSSLTIGTNINITVKNTVTEPIQIRVQGETIIAGDIVVSATASNPGPGGTAGGNCGVSVLCDQQDGSGGSSGVGKGGQRGAGAGGLAASGGGGGGAGFASAGATGAIGAAIGGTPGNPGAGGSAFVTLNSISTSLIGGVGGGAGGSGDDGLGNFASGGDGGNGSGSIAIISKGSITLTADASISANGVSGADGGAAGSAGGNGGAGSGGIIYLVTKEELTATAGVSININGGAQNSTAGRALGGAGSDGLFRVDTGDGTYTGNFGATTPGLTTTTPTGILDPLATTVTSTSELEYASEIDPSCTYRIGEKSALDKLLMSFILGLIMTLTLFKCNKLSRRFINSN